MKKYTIHFLIITLVTFALGFSGLEYPGAAAVRFICLVAGIGLMISCLDAVLLSRRQHKMKKVLRTQKIKNNNE